MRTRWTIVLAVAAMSTGISAWGKVMAQAPVSRPPLCETPICEATCANDITVVFQWDAATRSCVKHFAYPCEPWGCDAEGRTCNTFCVSDAECSNGGKCDTASSRCVTQTSFCADSFTVQHANGVQQSCAPYTCVGGGCQQQCTTNGDCAPGYACAGSHVCVAN